MDSNSTTPRDIAQRSSGKGVRGVSVHNKGVEGDAFGKQDLGVEREFWDRHKAADQRFQEALAAAGVSRGVIDAPGTQSPGPVMPATTATIRSSMG